jgi:RND family efflux transporter MFP subunit
MHTTTTTPGLATALALAALLTACAPKAEAPPDAPAVFVSSVRYDTAATQRVLYASVHPRVEAELSFRAGGKVTARLVDLGQSVRAGQALARLDAADYQLALAAAVEQQRAAEVEALQAASDATRFKRLLADGSVGAADAERQQARADAADARLAQAQKQVELARNRTGYAVLTAPFNGVVTALRLEAGQLVSEGQSVLSLARPGELEVVVDVPEGLVGQLTSWQASLVLPANSSATTTAGTSTGNHADAQVAPTQGLPLRLRELAPSANPASRTTRARYALAAPAPSAGLRMGMSAEVRLQKVGRVPAAQLPIGALLVTPVPASGAAASAGGASPAVWLVDASTSALQRQAVQLLAQSTDHIHVTGLPEGALVVTVGAHKLDAGLRVRPVQRPLDVMPATVLAR